MWGGAANGEPQDEAVLLKQALSRRRRRGPLRAWCGNQGKGEDVGGTSIGMGRPNWTAAMVTRLHVGEVLEFFARPRFRPNTETVR